MKELLAGQLTRCLRTDTCSGVVKSAFVSQSSEWHIVLLRQSKAAYSRHPPSRCVVVLYIAVGFSLLRNLCTVATLGLA